MKLPGGERAIVDVEKLTEYCLNWHHPRGRHKARVLESVLGLTVADAEDVRAALLTAAAMSEAVVVGHADEYGQRYVLDFDLSGPDGTGRVRSAWIVRSGEDRPRFTTCYLL
jgi:hypothetical protein